MAVLGEEAAATDRTIAFKTFGCRLNQAESLRIEEAFAAVGFVRAAGGAAPKITVVHSCVVTRAAEREVARELRLLRARYPETFLVLIGCAAETFEPGRLAELKLDLVVPQADKMRVAAWTLERLGLAPSAPRPVSRRWRRALLKVQDGCDFNCAYCIVPRARGQPVSAPFEACLDEARRHVAAGKQEIVVTGCNLACYRDGARGLLELVSALASLPGLGRLRLGSIEPGTLERGMVALMASTPQICRSLHLPLQSGDDGVLAAMGRRYTAEEVAETARLAREGMPGIGLGADVICGFPGETEAAFLRTRDLVARLGLSKLHVFPYSERPGTPAAGFSGSVPPTERKRRARELIEVGRGQRQAFAQTFVGKPVVFLAESLDKAGMARGWSGEYLDCRARGVPRDRLGSLVVFRPAAARDGALEG